MTNRLKLTLKPKTEWDSWKAELAVAQKRTHTSMDGDNYHPAELSAPAVRHGADDHMKCPSRNGNMLQYRDGREEKVQV